MAIDAMRAYGATFAASAGKRAATAATGTAAAPGQGGAQAPNVYQQLEDYVKMTPAQRMRMELLQKLGLTEEELAAKTPDERAGIEAKLSDMVREQMDRARSRQQGPQQPGQWVDTTA